MLTSLEIELLQKDKRDSFDRMLGLLPKLNKNTTIKIMLKDTIFQFSEEITKDISWVSISIEEAEALDQEGSFIYATFNSQNQCLYVGETGVSLQDRFKKNGAASHCKKSWYKDVNEVKYFRWELDDLPFIERRLLEQAVSLAFNPQNYGKPGRPKKQSRTPKIKKSVSSKSVKRKRHR